VHKYRSSASTTELSELGGVISCAIAPASPDRHASMLCSGPRLARKRRKRIGPFSVGTRWPCPGLAPTAGHCGQGVSHGAPRFLNRVSRSLRANIQAPGLSVSGPRRKKGAYLCWLSHRGNGEVSTVPITVHTDLQWSQPHVPRFPSGLRHRHHARSYGGKFYAC
jgi:hypothetical protein